MTSEQFRNLKVGDKIFRSGRLYPFVVMEISTDSIGVAQVKSLTLSDVSEWSLGCPEGLLGPAGRKEPAHAGVEPVPMI
jgi:hypothetical protein